MHGADGGARAESAAEKLFRGDLDRLSMRELLQMFSSVPVVRQTPCRSEGWLVDASFLAASGVTASKSEAVRLIKGGGIYVNGQRVADEKERLLPEDAIDGAYLRDSKGEEGQFPGPPRQALTSRVDSRDGPTYDRRRVRSERLLTAPSRCRADPRVLQ